MVKQYPYTLKWTDSTDGGFDANGFPTAGTETNFEVKCRYEAFTKGQFKELLNENNEVVYATGVIYVKKGLSFPERFKVIEVTEYELKAQVLQSYKGQLNTTLHVYELLK